MDALNFDGRQRLEIDEFEEELPVVEFIEPLNKGYYVPPREREVKQDYIVNINFNNFYNNARNGNVKLFKEALQELERSDVGSITRGDRPKNLWKYLTTTYSERETSVLMEAAYQGNAALVSEILNIALKYEGLLEAIITQETKYMSEFHIAFSLANSKGNTNVVKVFLNILETKAPELTHLLLFSTDHEESRISALYQALFDFNDDEMLGVILDGVTCPKLQSEMLLDQRINGYNLLMNMLNQNRSKILKKVFDIEARYRELKCEGILKTQDIIELINVSLYGGRNEITNIIIDFLIRYEPDSLKLLINNSRRRDNQLPMMTNLVLSANFEGIRKLYDFASGELKLPALPKGYISNIDKKSVYYVSAFDQGMRYFINIPGKKGLTEVSINDIDPTDNAPVVIKSANLDRSIILVNDFRNENRYHVYNELADWLSNALDLAKKHKVQQISASCHAFDHVSSILLTKNSQTNKWDVKLFDPGIGSVVNTKSLIPIIEAIASAGDVAIGSVEEETYIYNVAGKRLSGYCDPISSVMGAANIIGGDVLDEVKRECDTLGDRCVKVLLKRLNPKVDEILAEKLAYIVAQIESERELVQDDNEVSWAKTLEGNGGNTEYKRGF